ncbi:MAG: DNA translocase FtsK 4TM domain-containing protein, partial [Asticcacaulis sp.]|nr:DNA translocase FtsK 4TM domain-containing protein [Asticcacaulis sp.]
GACLALAGLSDLVALSTYHASDPSFNAVSHAPVANALGHFGAVIADIGWQSLGLPAWPAAVLMIYFGTLRTFHHDPDQTRGVLRLHALWACLFLVSLSAALGPLLTSTDPVTAQSLGGFWGHGINTLLAALFAFMHLPMGALIASLLFSGLAIYSFNQTLGLKFTAYLRLVQGIAGGAGFNRVVTGLTERLETSAAKVNAKAPAPAAPKVRKGKVAPIIDEDDDDGFETVESLVPNKSAPVAPRVEPKVAAKAPTSPPSFDDTPIDILPPKAAAPAPTKQPEFEFLRPSNFRLPDLQILAKPKVRSHAVDEESLRQNARMLESVLAEFGVRGVIDQIRPGPVVTLYELAPAAGVKGARVVALADDIARNMSARSCRVSVVQGRNAIGIELPNQTRETVYFRDLLASTEYERTNHTLPMALGETIGGEPYITDLAKMPHLLIAGTTGSGKSVGVNAMILSILYRLDPEQCKFIMIDPKMLELSVYDGIPHLLAPVVTDPKKAVVALKWTVKEMEDRYRRMSKIGVRNIASFNERARA